MKLTIKKEIFLALALVFAAAVLFVPIFAHAQSNPNLVVEFETDPLFGANDVKPGDEIKKQVHVTNNSESSQVILMEAINEFDPDNFGQGINLTVTDSDTLVEVYAGTFETFFDDGEIELLTLGSGETVWLDFVAFFPPESGNEYQTLSMGFDLLIGFEGDGGGGSNGGGGGDNGGEENGQGGDGDNGGGSGGGGGGGGSGGGGGILDVEGLLISNEGVREISVDPPTGTATITWDTNFPATSQVIYGLTSGGPYSINLTLPNFGYPLSTTEDPTLVTEHSVLLTGLIAGETYSFRVVSHASPATVSFEHTFVLAVGGGIGGPDGGGPDSGDSGSPSGGGGDGGAGGGTGGGGPTGTGAPGSSGDGGTGGGAGEAGSGGEESAGVSSEGNQLQGAALGLLSLPGSFLEWLECLGYFLIFIALIYIAWSLWKSRNRENYSERDLAKKQKLAFVVGSIVSIGIAYLLGWICAILPLLIVAIVAFILYIRNLSRSRED